VNIFAHMDVGLTPATVTMVYPIDPLTFIAYRYTINYVIRSFRDTEAEKIFGQQFSKKFQAIEKIALRKLIHINRAITMRDLGSIPGNQLEALKGNRKGQHSIRINDQYRICFRWNEGDAFDVEITDYH
jgi:proteic killer suppression protein